MKNIPRSAWIIGIALLMFTGPGFSMPLNAMDRKLEALIAAESALPLGADPGPPLKEVFARQFGDLGRDEMEDLSDYDLRLYLRASKTLAFYTYDPNYLELVELAFSELDARKVVDQHDFDSLFDSYIQYRKFEAAKALAMSHGEMSHPPLPEFHGLDDVFDGPTVLALDTDGSISRVPAGLAKSGPQIVVASHPLCHFSENAVRSIAKDVQLAKLFAGRTLWLMPQDGALDVDVVREWNREFADYEMRWAYQTSDWPMIKRWATPNFYFYLDGELVDTVIGWPPEGQRDALLAAFAKIGVVPEAADQRSR